MSGKVWMSSVMSNHAFGIKQGTRTKYRGHDWNPASFNLPVEPDEVYEACRRHRQGFALQRSDFPEAEAVFDRKRFARLGNLFFAGCFYAVKGRLAEILASFDLGEGGLIPFTIFQEDLVTPVDGEFFILNFGSRKNTIHIEQCEDTEKFYVDKNSGQQIYDVNQFNAEARIVISDAALEGPDLWFEETVYNKIFMSDALASALQESGLSNDWRLHACQVTEAGS
jgi:hypothetical protein